MKLPLPPTRDEISRQAHRRWQDLGSPSGRDIEIWLEAERALGANVRAETAAESTVEQPVSPAVSEAGTIKAALMKTEARAPQVPHHLGPKAEPPESGKPLWDKPHSR